MFTILVFLCYYEQQLNFSSFALSERNFHTQSLTCVYMYYLITGLIPVTSLVRERTFELDVLISNLCSKDLYCHPSEGVKYVWY